MEFEEELSHFDAAAERMIELGNELLDQDAGSTVGNSQAFWQVLLSSGFMHTSLAVTPAVNSAPR